MTEQTRRYTRFQATVLIVLQLFIGWHFLYEGLAKLMNPHWTAAGYLADSQWWFSGLFVQLAASPMGLTIVDLLNAWGLVAIGLGLMLGFLTRYAAWAGVVVLLLYYIAAPPFAGYVYGMPAEGSYLMVNKVLIEAAALGILLAFPTRSLFGLDKLFDIRRDRDYQALKRAHV